MNKYKITWSNGNTEVKIAESLGHLSNMTWESNIYITKIELIEEVK